MATVGAVYDTAPVVRTPADIIATSSSAVTVPDAVIAAPDDRDVAAGLQLGTYGYDLTGNRTSETVAGTTTHTLWDPLASQPALQRDADGVEIRAFLPAGLGVDHPDGRQFFHRDALGSIQATSDTAGAAAWTYNYTEYGLSTATWAGAGSQLTDSPVRFTGQLQDPTALIHLRARQYDPTTGMFLSPDPAGWGYTYGHANPLVFIDPYGTFGFSSIRRPLQFINQISGVAATGAAFAAMALTATGIGAPLGAVVGTLAGASGAIAAATGAVLAIDKCVNHKGGCLSSLMFAALDAGAAGRITRAIHPAPVLSRIAGAADEAKAAPRAPGLVDEAATVGRSASTEWGRVVQNFQQHGDDWTRFSAHAEQATGRAYRGGTSIEEIFRRGDDWLVRHRIYGPGGDVLHETFRPYAKFGQ